MEFSACLSLTPILQGFYTYGSRYIFQEDSGILLFHLMAVIHRFFTQDFNKHLNCSCGQKYYVIPSRVLYFSEVLIYFKSNQN